MKLNLFHIKKYYNGTAVLCGVSHTFESGKFYVIKGVSGSGKSTLLNIIGGLDRDFEGEITPDGNLTEWRTGYVFQNSLLLSGITVAENLLMIKNDNKKIRTLAAQLGVDGLLTKYPEQISGGERQRISILRMLLREPEVILMDEPTASLDAANSERIAELAAGLKCEEEKNASTERIVIIATHEYYFDRLADEIIFLDYGLLR
ncbi:MAG: ATP-binding cassette domain-containing protein [Lachnospiraceae bacterium]|nr:ATP-binding cassette domain-containing protein [Lachnospiraceae bacterium]